MKNLTAAGLLLCVLVVACAPSPAFEETSLAPVGESSPEVSVTSTSTSTPTDTPTAVPTPLGSGGIPRFAWINHAGLDLFVEIFEFETPARLTASLPLVSGAGRDQFLRFSPDGKALAYNDVVEEENILFLYDFETESSSRVLSIPANVYLDDLKWSPSSSFISYSYYFYGGSVQHWLYSFETGQSTFVGRGFTGDWLLDRDVFVYQNLSSVRLYFDATTGRETPAPKVNIYRLGSCSRRCYIPSLDAFELIINDRESNEVHYHLFASDTGEEQAFVARIASLDANISEVAFNDIIALSRGGYILYLKMWTGDCPDCTTSVYTVWDTEGKLPIEVMSSPTTNSLVNVVPVALSEDERYFIGIRREDVEHYAAGSFSIVIVELQTGKVIRAHRYPAVQPPAPGGLMNVLGVLWSQRSFDQYPTSIDVYWGETN